ncbi:Polyketide cyclase/dehydrase [Actinobacteria bacterium OK074]|nr:Polyketide cyclase/dehydrase [Actinobacteria bacterium OK074]
MSDNTADHTADHVADHVAEEPAAERLEARREIAAPPAKVFELLCSPNGHVTIDSSGMLQSAEGTPVAKAGDTFVVHMDRESLGDRPLGKYDVTVEITEYEQDELIEWTVSSPLVQPSVGHRYGYRLEPAGEGATLVTSYYDWSGIVEPYRSRLPFPVIQPTALRATLGILARTVE